MMRQSIPASLDQIDLHWVRDVLAHDKDDFDPGLLRGLEQEPLGESRGFTSQLARLHLDWEDASEGPASLVVKLHASDRAKATFAKLAYEHEYLFYQHFAAHSPVPTPHCYYAAYDPDEIRFVLVLDDLSELEPGDQIAGTSDANIDNAIRSLATLHAKFWNDEEIVRRLLGGIASAPPDGKSMLEFWRTQLDELKATRAKKLPMIILIGEKILKVLSAQDFQFPPPQPPSPFTLVHGDYRLDNMFFGGRVNPMTVIDWGVGVGRGGGDLGYFLLLSLTTEQFRQKGLALTTLYHATLVEHGVHDCSLRQVQNDCREMFSKLATTAIALQVMLDRKDSDGPSTGDNRRFVPIPALEFVSDALANDRCLLLVKTWVERVESGLGIWFTQGRHSG